MFKCKIPAGVTKIPVISHIMKYTLILLIFTQVFYDNNYASSSLLPFRKHTGNNARARKFEGSSIQENSNSQNCAEDCTCLTCNHTLPKPKKVINPYKKALDNRVEPKPFGNFCIKCVACLAVANEIQNVIEHISQECETDLKKRRVLFEEIEMEINNLCSKGFKNYDLRFYENHGIITNNFECTSLIDNLTEKNWTKKLREICNLYISRVNIESVSSNVLDSITNLTDTFCRGTGVFRDCNNIKSHENITLPRNKNYES